DGTDQEIFTMEELVEKFSVERISKSGAKFDYEKAKWFNHEWIKNTANDQLLPEIDKLLKDNGVSTADPALIDAVLSAIKERLTFLSDFWQQASFFFVHLERYDVEAIRPKWNTHKTAFFEDIVHIFEEQSEWKAAVIDTLFKDKIAQYGMNMGELMLPYRIMLVDGKFGADVLLITELLGQEEVISRMKKALPLF